MAKFIPSARKNMEKHMYDSMQMTTFKEEDYQHTVYSLNFIKACVYARYLDIFKEARLNSKPKDCNVIALGEVSTGHTLTNLLKFQKRGRPLVLNFGSCTWPPFVAKLEHFNNVVARFAANVDFVVIYIEEAHPTDGWAFSNNFDIKNHRTIEDRIDAAKQLQTIGVNCPIVVDEMSNKANIIYGGFYERLYILLDDLVVYEGQRGPVGYDLHEMERWLDDNVKLN